MDSLSPAFPFSREMQTGIDRLAAQLIDRVPIRAAAELTLHRERSDCDEVGEIDLTLIVLRALIAEIGEFEAEHGLPLED